MIMLPDRIRSWRLSSRMEGDIFWGLIPNWLVFDFFFFNAQFLQTEDDVQRKGDCS